MSITGPGSITAATVTALTNMMNQLNTLGQELGSGQAAQTYSGLGSQAGVALALNAQLAAINGYSSTASIVGTTLTVAQSVLTQLGSTGSAVQQSVSQQGAFTLDNNGQTTTQEAAASQLDQILALLNTQVGNNYIFSGSAVNQPSVASTSEILNGNGAQAGLTQVIADHLQADAAVAGRIAARDGVINLGERQQPPGKGCILGLFGRHAKLWASEVSAKADRGGRSDSPSFIMVSNTAVRGIDTTILG